MCRWHGTLEQFLNHEVCKSQRNSNTCLLELLSINNNNYDHMLRTYEASAAMLDALCMITFHNSNNLLR